MKKVFLVFLLFFFLTTIVFRQYVFFHKVPFAGNLLVSFYEPWKSYEWGGYGKNGPANKPIGFDSLRIFYPLRSLTIDSLKHLQLPLWNPYDFSGNTHLATYQSAVFFPLTPLFLVFSQIDAWSLTVFLAPLLACSFMYLFLRSLLLSQKSSIMGAVVFGFSGGILVLVEESFMAVYSLLFLPLILWGIYMFFQKNTKLWLLVTTVGIVSSILSGWFQSSLYVTGLSFLWVVFLGVRQKKLKSFFWMVGAFVSAFLIAGIHLIPNFESYLYSARGTTDAKYLFDVYLLQPWHLITYLAPDFFGNPGTYNYFDNGFYYEKILSIGVVGLFLGLISFFQLKKTTEEWFFTVFWAVTVSLGLSIPTSWFLLYHLHIPLISTILPSRIFLVSAFCLSVMAAYGLEALLTKKTKIAYALVVLLTGGVVALTWKFLFLQKTVDPTGHFATISYRNFFLPTILVVGTLCVGLLLLFPQKRLKYMGFLALLGIALVGIVYFSDKYLYFSEKQFTFPQTPVLQKLSKISGNDRVWSFGEGYIERNFFTYYHIQSPEGYDSFYLRSYGELVEASKNGGKFTTDIPRADAQLTGVGKLSEIPRNPSLFKLLNLLGVKYIVAKKNSEDETFLNGDPEHLFQMVWTDGTYNMYKNTQAFPRAFLVDTYQLAPSNSLQLQKVFNDSTDLRHSVILSSKPLLSVNSTPLVENVTITKYQSEHVEMHAQSNKDALLILTDNMYPGWKAFIDGKQTPIFSADHTFRSIVLPKGKHTVLFSYQPLSVAVGSIISLVGVLLFIVLSFTI